MSEPDQCIVCLDPLPRPSAALDADPIVTLPVSDGVAAVAQGEPAPAATATATATATASDTLEGGSSCLNIVAALDGCDHIIHDACIRSWAKMTNTCPICRNPFHSVRVYNGLDGTAISTYEVQDKKQVADFDIHQWMGDNPEVEEEQGNPCPVCDSAEQEDVLLLCDSCDAAYHTHCIGLDGIPDGDWYCMECRHLFQLADDPEPTEAFDHSLRPQHIQRPIPRSVRGYHVRTRERLRRARRQARNVEWQGTWGRFSGQVYEMSELDLDNHDEEDEELEQFRRFQENRRREINRWQQRIDIARRLGAREVFASNIPPSISERLQPPTPEPVRESLDERRAWGALDRVRESQDANPNSRKRKMRSVTASPRETVQEPERKLKRPRTRRLTTQNGEGSSSVSSPAPAGPSNSRVTNGSSSTNGVVSHNDVGPPLVSSLLRELEPNQMSDDDASASNIGYRHPPEASSPAGSPLHSPHSSPRALSLTPPLFPSLGGRPNSPPPLSLSTHIQPQYRPANYSPSRKSPSRKSPSRMSSDDSETRSTKNPANYSPSRKSRSNGDSETRPTRLPEGRPLEIRQPRPRRPHEVVKQTEELSPSIATMTPEEKKNINEIVKGALRPHWRAQKLTTEQYATINRDISRKLYDQVKDAATLNNEARLVWEKQATQEVAQAVAKLEA